MFKVNIKVDDPKAPTWMRIFDHERCLFHLYPKEGVKSLRERQDRLGLTDGSHSGNEWHCLIQHLQSVEHIKKWVRRVADIPDWFIEDICFDVWKVSITKKERDAVIKFLKRRRDEIGALILNHRSRFQGIKFSDWPLFL